MKDSGDLAWLGFYTRECLPEGFHFYEFRPAIYDGFCWSEKSCYLTEELFLLLWPQLTKGGLDLDRYGLTELEVKESESIHHAMIQLAEKLGKASAWSEIKGDLGPLAIVRQTDFEENWEETRKPLQRSCGYLAGWFGYYLGESARVTVIGL